MRHLLFGITYVSRYWIAGKHAPLICGLVLHNTCNLRCRHCSVVDRTESRISYKEACNVIDEFYERKGRTLYLEGGEPFLWKEKGHSMEDIVSYARSKGFHAVIIYTNGTKPLDSNADTIFVSIDGLKEKHDALRGRSFDRIIENIRNSDHPSIYINYTINSVNKDELEAFCSFIDTIPQVKGVFFYFHTPYYGYDELFLNEGQKEALIDKLLLLRKKYRLLNSRPGLRSAKRNRWKRPLDFCQVYEGGKYYTCCRESDDIALCKDCGYLSYPEIEETLKLRPGAIRSALKYF